MPLVDIVKVHLLIRLLLFGLFRVIRSKAVFLVDARPSLIYILVFLLLFDASPASDRFAVVLFFYSIDILEEVSVGIVNEVSLNLSEPPRGSY